MSLKDNIYDMMLLRRMTIAELSEKSGVSRNSLYVIFRGKTSEHNMKLQTIKKIAEALGCTPAWLIEK